MLERKTIRVLTVFNRTDYFLQKGKPYGFEYSLLEEYEKHLNRHTKARELWVHLEWYPVPFDRLMPYLKEGKGDLAAAGITVTEERLREVDFTLSYLRPVDEVVVSHAGVQGLTSLEALAG